MIDDRSGAIWAAVLRVPFGALAVRVDHRAVREIRFLPPGAAAVAPRGPIAQEAIAQLRAYLADPDFAFDLPLEGTGTPFQKRVWQAIGAIPRGQVKRYGELSSELASAPRAVGQACGANPLPVVVPCHRVVAARSIGGFANARAGFLLDAKIWLLRHEGVLL